MTNEQRDNYIKALIRERDGYLLAGNQDAAAGVTAELRRVGAEGSPPVKKATKRNSARVS